jgi:hypothetical protein
VVVFRPADKHITGKRHQRERQQYQKSMRVSGEHGLCFSQQENHLNIIIPDNMA